jgi:hypothetical protein
MYLDTAEQAPAFVPKDVTGELGLPADLEAERIFIHKTANYENYIVVQGGKVVAYTPGIEDEEPLLIFTLDKGEDVNGITSVGNTIIVSTFSRTIYILFANNSYKLLGSEIPIPHIEFRSISNYYALSTNKSLQLASGTSDGFYSPIDTFNVDIWNKAIEDIKDDNTTEYTSSLLKIKEDLWSSIEKEIDVFRDKDLFWAPFFVRFAVKLYDGSYTNQSVPILLGAGFDEFLEISGHKIVSSSNLSAYISYRLKNIFQAKAYLLKWETDGWEDIVKSVDIFASTNIYYPYYNSMFGELKQSSYSGESPVQTYNYQISFDSSGLPKFDAIEEELLSKSVFSKIGSFNIKDSYLNDGWNLASSSNIKYESVLLEADKLLDQSITEIHSFTHLFNYNNRLIAPRQRSILPKGYSFLNATNIPLRGGSYNSAEQPLALKFYVKDSTQRIRLGESFDGSFYYETYQIDTSDEGGQSSSQAMPLGFIAYPDPNCYKVEILADDEALYKVDMKPHPYLNCSYAFIGLSKAIASPDTFVGRSNHDDFLVENVEKEDSSKLDIFRPDNPFVIDKTFTFQSNVIGVAVATTTLSQGQFGQFPLYVFTEDGIWAMETAADGSFISQKPLSREVCINPDSICSIDNAVVFVTDKAVMMIQGSQVMNISPYMNGRHYTPNDSALNLIRNQEGFDTLIEPISDDDPFMSFMKDAKVAYDYTGQRLVFISPSNNGFQYVYKIDTQTWHKVAFDELELNTPLNSYPECLVANKSSYYIFVDSPADHIDEALSARIDESLKDLKSHFTNDIIGTPNILERKNIEQLCLGNINIEGLRKDDAEYIRDIINEHCDNDATTGLKTAKIYSLSTVLDAKPDPENPQKVAKGILITRPFDLGMPDVYKSITSIKIRGDYDKGDVKYILQGSDDGRTFYTLSSLRGKSWKMFRIFILADLEPTERISWIDIDFEPRYQNKLR